MSKTVRIFSGMDVVAKGLIARLNDIGLSPIERRDHESAVLAGFAASIPQQTQLFLMEEQLEKAQQTIDDYLKEIA